MDHIWKPMTFVEFVSVNPNEIHHTIPANKKKKRESLGYKSMANSYTLHSNIYSTKKKIKINEKKKTPT